MSSSRTGLGVIADDGLRGGGDDSVAESIIELLRSEGAVRLRHAGGRTLLDHLVEAYAIVRRWKQPVWLQHAALIHSIYGTDAFHQRLLPLSRRRDVARVAGAGAERLAYLFCVTARAPLLAGTHRWARGMPSSTSGSAPDAPDETAATRAELDALVLLHMANLAEQAQAQDGSPGRWLVRVREVAELLIDSDEVSLPLFIAGLAAFSAADESLTRRTYLDAVKRADDLEARASRLALAAALCPVVAEPCVWQAHLSLVRHDVQSARWWAGCARQRLLELGTVWDKRLTFDEWLKLTETLAGSAGHDRPAAIDTVTDPRQLYETTVNALAGAESSRLCTEAAVARPQPHQGTNRFIRYVEGFTDDDSTAPGAIYPDLPSQPWYDPQSFPLVTYLESHYPAIRDEILALDPARFHRESERIKRSGEWDVVFLYERGLRHDEVCEACPVTTRGIEAYPTIRTIAGLIYVSRMRGSTHIRPHRGPTNLRVRCHLGIRVPDGDCAIRVGEQTRQWQEGKCLVFDDYFEHEAWNATGEDRLVLIVDLWHPGLSRTEVALLEGLHRYTYTHARRLNRYWSANAAAAAEAGA